jgi:hypothetical protein
LPERDPIGIGTAIRDPESSGRRGLDEAKEVILRDPASHIGGKEKDRVVAVLSRIQGVPRGTDREAP